MTPTQILSREHRVIEAVLVCLDRIVEDALAKARLDATSAEEVLDFLRGYADRCHHGKEEELLFPALEERGFPRDAGPTAVMRMEHVTGRNFVKAMARVVASAAHGDTKALDVFCSQARGFTGMLRQHIVKEDECLFTMANNTLDDATMERITGAFQEFEESEMDAGDHERLIQVAMDLGRRWGVAIEDGHDGFVAYSQGESQPIGRKTE